MGSPIDSARHVLESFLALKRDGMSAPIDREQIVAHATLSGWVDHWPSEALAAPGGTGLRELLNATREIRSIEHGRWVVQRRIAIAKLSARA